MLTLKEFLIEKRLQADVIINKKYQFKTRLSYLKEMIRLRYGLFSLYDACFENRDHDGYMISSDYCNISWFDDAKGAFTI